MKFEKLPLSEQRTTQWQNFQDIFKYCNGHIPYYKEKFRSNNTDIKDFKDLRKIPKLTKKDIEMNFPDKITRQTSNRSDWEYQATSGTTNRLICVNDRDLRGHQSARELRTMNIAGECFPGRKRQTIPPDVCSITCGTRKNEKEMLWEAFKNIISDKKKKFTDIYSFIKKNQWRIFRMMVFRDNELPSFGSEGTALEDKELEYYIEEIRRYKPYLLSGLPTYLHMLAHFVTNNKCKLPPVSIIKPIGATLSPEIKRFISNAFRCDVFEDYGSHEFVGIASECKAHSGNHVAMSEYLVEIVRKDRHAEEGELGNILITDLKNKVMPFVRYEIGDVGRFYKQKCMCGRESIRITVEGRLQDLIISDDGKEYTSDYFQDFFFNFKGVKYFQLIQDTRGRTQVLIVQNENQKCDKDKLTRALKDILGEIQVRLNFVKKIPPETSGKFRFVKSCSYFDLVKN